MLPLFFSEGVGKQRISIHRFVEATATNAARLFGIFPRKGTIAVGSDADLAIWDPALTRTFDSSQFESNADFSPYDGWEVTGWPVTTISRGEVVCQDGEIVAGAGRGQFIPQGPTQML